MSNLPMYARLGREWLRLALDARCWPNNALFVRAAYHMLLGRAPDADGLAHYLSVLEGGHMRRRGLVRELLQSKEFQQTAGLEIGTLEALHRARKLLFATCLPPAEVIVDLGGASHEHPDGALLNMGYPHRPREITIIDLPPADRLGGAHPAEQSHELRTGAGTLVRYIYDSMSNLSAIGDASVDLVVSGESIEHVSEAEADRVCQEAFRVLRSGGRFCLDTPNAALTRILSPDKLIHPEHQKEYTVAELRSKLQRYGFAISAAKAICPMPETLRSGVFDYGEMIRNCGLADDAGVGFLFYLEASKPDIPCS